MSVPYIVMVYDSGGLLVAALENATNPSYSRAKNSADQVSISVPRGDPKASLIKAGQRFEIMRESSSGLSLETSGYISEHGYEGDEYIIEGYTEEILLSRYLTPAQFGWPLQLGSGNLAQLVEGMQSGYVVERVKGDWVRGGTSTSGVDTTSNPEFVILATDAADPSVLRESGWIALRFEKTDEQSWDRFRWVSDYDPKGVYTSTVQYRQGNDTFELAASGFTEETPGAAPDIQGIEVASKSARYLEVRVNLYTGDTSASPVLYALEAIKREPTAITGVSYPPEAASLTLPGIDADNKSFMDVMIDVCDALKWEFRVVDGTLEVAESFGTSRLNDYTLVGS